MNTHYRWSNAHRAAPRGYTLAEMLSVLAIITAVAALALPTVLRPYYKSELEDAARQVRNALSEARITAIETGRPQAFRFEPGGRRYEWSPRLLPGEETVAAVAVDAPAAVLGVGAELNEAVVEELPAGVCFLAPEAGPAAATDEPAVPAAPLAATAAGAEGEGWSDEIVFYPDGRAHTARIRLRGADEMEVALFLRGLTGTTTVSAPTRAEEAATETELTIQ